jgi:hypothetical protein
LLGCPVVLLGPPKLVGPFGIQGDAIEALEHHLLGHRELIPATLKKFLLGDGDGEGDAEVFQK